MRRTFGRSEGGGRYQGWSLGPGGCLLAALGYLVIGAVIGGMVLVILG
jgi:hypothetical protein